MRAAAAQVAIERRAHFAFGRPWVLREEPGGADQDAAGAVAALRRLLGEKRILKGMQSTRRSEAFHRNDVLARDRPQRRVARGHGVAVDENEAGSALSATTPEAGALEPEV